MYEEHDTDARTHATDLNGVGASPTRSYGRVFGILPLCFITTKKSYVRHHRYSGIPSTSARR